MLREKSKNDGFTLAELLIIVAIIAVLVAVSIPIFTAQLDKVRKSTDEANLRACKSLVINAIITEEYPDESWINNDTYKTATAVYDAGKGCLVRSVVDLKGYGKGSDTEGFTNNTDSAELAFWASNTSIENGCLYVTVYKENNYFVIFWAPAE